MQLIPKFEGFADRVRDSFGQQGFMKLIGAELGVVEAGTVEIVLPYDPKVTQQHGYFHGGVVGTLADNAGGYAAYTMLDRDEECLTAEYKINILAPGRGEKLLARGHVLKPGRTLIISRTDVYAVANGVETLCATSLMTLARVQGQNMKKPWGCPR